MSKHAWLTPNVPSPATFQTWTIVIPSQFLEHIRGAIGELSNSWNWEQYGSMTPDDAASSMFAAWLTLRRSLLIGTVHDYFTSTLPDGVLLCDGSVYNRSDYPDLYSVIDAAFIDDEDTFHVPNLIGRCTIGCDTGIGQEIGEAAHTLSVDEIPQHHHSIPDGATFPYGEIPEITVTGGILLSQTGDTGGGQSHNNMQPSTRVYKGMIAW